MAEDANNAVTSSEGRRGIGTGEVLLMGRGLGDCIGCYVRCGGSGTNGW